MRACSVSAMTEALVARWRREKIPRVGDHLAAIVRQLSGDHCARGFRVTAAAEPARKRIHVDLAGAAERDLHLAMTEIAEEDRHLRPCNRARVLDDSVEILL